MQRKRVVAAGELPFVLGYGEAPDVRRRDFPAPQISAVKVRLGIYSNAVIAIARASPGTPCKREPIEICAPGCEMSKSVNLRHQAAMQVVCRDLF
ncbi:MAG: hypothetical protein J0I99_18380 [Devosia sp.]|uniref:hypothetical protein n=1 Tax=Devosia sp. TaxID=1871048 RepID=UPI001AD50D21|nr:hypothetical protein [Devosia sp.]MBN9317711.1 hypothetical protein [Devosia sp.]